jgi:hypothetical protein
MAGVAWGEGVPARRIALGVFWILLIVCSYVIGSLLLLVVVNTLGLRDFFSTTVGVLSAHVVLLLMMLGIMAAGNILLVRRYFTLQESGLTRPMSWRDIGLGVAGFVLYALLSMLTLTLARAVPGFHLEEAQQLGLTTLFGMERLLGFLVLVILTPFFEELLFRGILFSKLRTAHLGFWPTTVLISALFGVAHGQWNVGLDVFCLSMVACYLRETTGTIWAGVLIHMMKNMIAFYFLFVALQGIGS